MSNVEITRINNFQCPACGEMIGQVTVTDGVVKGWCRSAKKEIKVSINQIKEEKITALKVEEPRSFLETLRGKRAKVLKEVVSAREDGDLKDNPLTMRRENN